MRGAALRMALMCVPFISPTADSPAGASLLLTQRIGS
jgi:hypothetical protein